MENVRKLAISCDLIYGTLPVSRSLKQGDTTRLTMDVRRGGEPYDLNGLGLLLNVKRADKLAYIQAGGYELNGNVVTWTLEDPIVAEPGQIELEAVLTAESGEVVSSFAFRLNIEPRLLSGDEDIAPEDQNEIIDAARDAALSVTQAREARDAAAQSEANAQASAKAAEGSAQAAKESAASADTSAKAAADSEVKAKASQESAAQSAVSAQSSANAAQEAQASAESANGSAAASAENAKKDADRAETAASAASGNAASASVSANSASASESSARSNASSAASSASAALQSAARAAASEAAAAQSAERAQDTVDNAGFAAMEIGEDGYLYLIRTDNIVDLIDFSINENGVLEAVVS